MGAAYRGRFAPSPTGPLHAGSLVAALASWLDARAHQGRWLVRIEDVDTPRCVPGADHLILEQLAQCGLVPDEPPVYQSQRGALYQQALDSLTTRGLAYPCACTRQDIARALAASGQARERHGELVYPGTCRGGLHGRSARAWRLDTQAAINSIANLSSSLAGPAPASGPPVAGRRPHEVGDFVLKRADGLWAYQLAVVVDDAAQGITDIVRGEDLADNTARQILLQRALGLPLPRYLHTPLVLGANGEKLSKQNGAQALDTPEPLAQAGKALGLDRRAPFWAAAFAHQAATPQDWLRQAVPLWAERLKIKR
jgi:glutamyl-Q tRNA(Asp) synthetase